MKAAKRSFGLFFTGLLLAAVVAVGGGVFGDRHSSDTDLLAEADLMSDGGQELSPEMRDLLSPNVKNERKVEILSAALHAGTIDSLQLFWPHLLNQIPDYESTIEPDIRYQALYALALRFERNDWEHWKEISGQAQVDGSDARTFVDDLAVINPSLGRFLETSGYLFSELYVSTLKGAAFDEAAALQHLVQNADSMLNRRRISALPASLQVEPGLLSDKQFYAVFEPIRGKLVSSYIAQKTSDLNNQLNLVLSLNSSYSSQRFIMAVEHVIYRIILQTNAQQRLKIIDSWEKLEALKVYASDDDIRKALSRLYLTLSLDAMERGDKAQAGQLYASATSLGAHVSMHYSIGDFIESGVLSKQRPVVVATKVAEESADNAGGLLFGASSDNLKESVSDQIEQAEEVSVSVLFYVIMFFFAGGALLLTFFFVRRVFSEQLSPAGFDVVEPLGDADPAVAKSKVKGFPSPAEIKRKRVNL